MSFSPVLTVKALSTTTLIQVAATASMVTMATIAPLVAQDLDVPASMIGSYVAILYVGAALAAVCGGNLVRHFGGIHVSQAALLLSAVGLLLGCTPSLLLVAVSAFIVGLGYGPITPASSDILAHCVPKHRMGIVFSLKQTGVPLGGALAGLVVPGVAASYGWITGVNTIVAICLVLVIASFAVRSDLDDHIDRRASFSLAAVASSLRLVLSMSALRRMAIVSFVYNGMQMCVLGFTVSYLVQDRGFSLVFAGLALSCANAGGVCGRIFWGWLADKVHSPRLTLAGLGFLMAGATVTVATAQPDWSSTLVLVSFCILGATSIGWNGVYLANVARVAPEGMAGVATGGTLFFTFVGAMILPALFGGIERLSGSYSLSYFCIAGLCACIGAWLVLFKDTKKPA